MAEVKKFNKIEIKNVATGKNALHHRNSPWYAVRDPYSAHPDAVPVEILELNEENVRKLKFEPDKYFVAVVEDQYVNNIVVIGDNNTLGGQIKNLANSRTGGPYYMDGRDGVLNIHNKKTSRPVSKVYTYAGGNGELLEFGVASKYTTTTVSLARSSGIDPDTKSQENLQTQVVSTGEFAEGDRGYMLFSDDYHLDVSRTPDKGGWSFSSDQLRLTYSSPGYNSTPVSGEDGLYYRIKKNGRKRVGDNQYVGGGKVSGPNTGKPYAIVTNTGIPDGEIIDYLDSTRRVYDSREHALSTEQSINMVTEQEVQEYVRILEEHGKILKGEIPDNWTSWSEDERGKWWDDHHHLKVLPPFKIKRNITYTIPVQVEFDFDIRENANLLSVVHLKGSIAPLTYSVGNKNSVVKALTALGKTNNQEIKVLAIYDPMVEATVSRNDLVQGRQILLYVEETIELYLNGVEVLAGSTIVQDIVNSSWVEQDLLKKTTDAVKANATILGDPTVESSMNIQIQNVSSRYSGVWYTKKVTHKFSESEGYIMDIEFEKRNIPIKSIKIHTRTNSASKFMSMSKAAKEKYEDGTWDLSNRLSIEIDTIKARYPEYSVLYRMDSGNHSRYTVYIADKAVSTDKLEEKINNNDLSGVTVEYIDLKNTQLPEEEL